MDLLDCTVMTYAWGSRTAIAELRGLPSPAPTPEAELWMGAHPLAPSRIVRDGETRSLLDVIAAQPEQELGGAVVRALGPRLPFLMKVLAAREPLSLQAHPDAARAARGFAEEDARGLARDAATRNYKDPSHKPEVLCALTTFDALCGFRPVDRTLALFDELAVSELADVIAPLRARADAGGLEETFARIMRLSEEERPRVVRAVVEACARREEADATDFPRELALARRLATLYPDDAGIVSALLLNLVRLEPGEAVYLGAGNLHAYLEGTGVEIMASSDNVLRGGLTKKHVDVEELLAVLSFEPGPVPLVRPRARGAVERVYDTPAPEFRLSTLELGLGPREPFALTASGPEILLATRGVANVSAPGTTLALARGQALFVPASTRRYTLEGDATVFRAQVGLDLGI